MDGKKDRMDIGLQKALVYESEKFRKSYLWLKEAMPPLFFQEISPEDLLLICHNLVVLPLQDYFSRIHIKRGAIVLCLNTLDADLRILKDYAFYGIRNYNVYVSKKPLPYEGRDQFLRIASLSFTGPFEESDEKEDPSLIDELKTYVKQKNPPITEQEIQVAIQEISHRFLKTTPKDKLFLALDLYFRAKTRDNCQYEVRYDENWEEKGTSSMCIVLAWKNTPKHNFLYRMVRVIHRNLLEVRRVSANYIDPYGRNSILVMVIHLHGMNGKACWDVADIPDFLREFVTVKYFASFDEIDRHLVSTKVISGSLGNFLRAATSFIHQSLVLIDPHLYSLRHIEEAFCSHPELTEKICKMFCYKFEPNLVDLEKFQKLQKEFLWDVEKLDTGQEMADQRRKAIFRQANHLLNYMYKTNFFRYNYTAISFRLDPKYLKEIPFETEKFFPEMPYAIFFIKGMHYIGFHIRFKDLARGGLRTVYPRNKQESEEERNKILLECYYLAWTQHKKNKDIPEAGAKGIIFLSPFERLISETTILEGELESEKFEKEEVEKKLTTFMAEQRVEYLHQAQRSYIEAFVTLLNCEPDGSLKAKHIVDYWKRPEYIYLGPDENMHDSVIEWIAWFSQNYGYKPGRTFITGKKTSGINHKKYGVTSLGVNVFMHHALDFLGIDPKKKEFTIKMTGGPDGDVAGNQIKNLFLFYSKTAKLVALTDGTGTIYEPKGLNLEILVEMFEKAQGIRFYPSELLSENGFLLDKFSKRQHTSFSQQTLCFRKKNGKVIKDWLSGNEMNLLLRTNVHATYADVFIPAGGRPRTLNLENINDFLDESGEPTSKIIIEGANLYLSERARSFLEDKGVLIIKDSSANKTGVICSSFEVLVGLTLNEKDFEENRDKIVKQILQKLETAAYFEAITLLSTHKKTGEKLTILSDKISKKINQYTYEILDFLDVLPFPKDFSDPLVTCFLQYCLSFLRENFKEKLMEEIPDHHKKAIVACFLASRVVYRKGLDWSPSILDVLPVLHSDPDIMQDDRFDNVS